MDLPLAAGLVAAAGALWIRRRMMYLYPPFEQDPDDENDDLQALPAVITRLRRAVREQAAALPEAFPTPRDPDAGEPAPFPHLPVPPGPGIGAGLGIPTVPAGLGLLGAGAPAAARALLVAALTTPPLGPSGVAADVIITRAALTALLPRWQADSGSGAHLMIAADLDEAIALLHDRAHPGTANDPGTDQVAPTHPDDDAPTAPRSALLLITEVPPTHQSPQLAQTLRAGTDLGTRAVLLGNWAPGKNLTVENDGYISASTVDSHPQRISVLDETTTLSLLPFLHEASTRRASPKRSGAPTPARKNASTLHHGPTTETDPGPGPGPGPSEPPGVRASRGLHAKEPATSGRIPVRLLGSPTIFRRDGTPVSGLRRHATELLVYLAVHRNGARLPEIMEALWPDATVRRAQQRLSTETANLRRSIRSAADDPQSQPVINTGGHYHLDPATLDIDVWRLFDHLDAAVTADTHQQARHLRAALEVASTVLAEDCDYDWIHPAREHLRRQNIRALLALANHPDTDPHEAAALTTQAADLDPVSEDLALRSMRALAAVGDTHAIPDRLNRLRQALDSIGERPSPATLTLAADLSAPTSRASR